MSKPKILIQLDPDPQPSTFDSVVAVDSGVEQLFRHDSVTVENVEPLVHGAIFTRGPQDLKSTAIFIGGSDIGQGESILKKVKSTFFGPMSVSVMLDSNGSNTTAAAAVLSAAQQVDLQGAKVAVLGGTGPVGQRIAMMAARQGAAVALGSRSLARSEPVCQSLSQQDADWKITPFSTEADDWESAIADTEILFAAGAAGYELITREQLKRLSCLKAAVDLNAVPPAGIPDVDVMMAGADVKGISCYGAIGVGGLKMKIHKAALKQLFTRNDLILNAAEIYDLGNAILSEK